MLVANIQAACLVVGTVGGAGHFTPLASVAATWHPGLQIEFAIGRASQIAGRRIDHSIRNRQFVEQPALQVAEVIEHAVALVGSGESEHLDFGELVHAIQPTRRATGRARFRTETVTDAAQLDGQLFGIEDIARHQSTEWDFGRGDQVQVRVLDTVDLCFGTAWEYNRFPAESRSRPGRA